MRNIKNILSKLSARTVAIVCAIAIVVIGLPFAASAESVTLSNGQSFTVDFGNAAYSGANPTALHDNNGNVTTEVIQKDGRTAYHAAINKAGKDFGTYSTADDTTTTEINEKHYSKYYFDLYNTEGQAISIAKNAYYAVTFEYYLASADQDVYVTIMQNGTARMGNKTYTTGHGGNTYFKILKDGTGKWVTVTGVMAIGSNITTTSLALSFGKGADLYIANLKIERLRDGATTAGNYALIPDNTTYPLDKPYYTFAAEADGVTTAKYSDILDTQYYNDNGAEKMISWLNAEGTAALDMTTSPVKDGVVKCAWKDKPINTNAIPVDFNNAAYQGANPTALHDNNGNVTTEVIQKDGRTAYHAAINRSGKEFGAWNSTNLNTPYYFDLYNTEGQKISIAKNAYYAVTFEYYLASGDQDVYAYVIENGTARMGNKTYTTGHGGNTYFKILKDGTGKWVTVTGVMVVGKDFTTASLALSKGKNADLYIANLKIERLRDGATTAGKYALIPDTTEYPLQVPYYTYEGGENGVTTKTYAEILTNQTYTDAEKTATIAWLNAESSALDMTKTPAGDAAVKCKWDVQSLTPTPGGPPSSQIEGYYNIDFDTTENGTVDANDAKSANDYNATFEVADFPGTTNKAFHFKSDTDKHVGSISKITRLMFKDGSGNYIETTPGEKYVISYEYYLKTNATTNSNKLYIGFENRNTSNAFHILQFFPTTASKASQQYIYSAYHAIPYGNTQEGRWITQTDVVTIGTTTSGSNQKYLALVMMGGKNTEGYIDNIKIRKLEDNEQAVVVSTVSGMKLNTPYYIVTKGEDYILPTNVEYYDSASQMTFEGWYTDKDCSADKKVSSFTAVDDNKLVYARWVIAARDKYFIDFEGNGTVDLESSSTANPKKALFEVVDGANGKMLHFKAPDPNKSVADNGKSAASLALVDASGKPVTVKAGQKYVISYDYYIVTNAASGNLYLGLSARAGGEYTLGKYGNIVSTNEKQLGYKAPNDLTVVDKWSVVTDTMTFENARDCITFAFSGGKGSEGYIDNIRIEAVAADEAVVIAKSGYAQTQPYFIVKKNANVTLPKLDGAALGTKKTFYGWYADEDLSQPIGTFKTDKDIFVYANWAFAAGQRLVCGFEDDYTFDFQSGKYTKQLSRVTDYATEGKYSLKFDTNIPNSNGNPGISMYTSIPLMFDGENIIAKKGERYAVSFDYYLITPPTINIERPGITFYTGSIGYTARTIYTTQDLKEEEPILGVNTKNQAVVYQLTQNTPLEKWGTYAGVITTQRNGELALSLAGGANTDFRIDNITITRLDDNQSALTFSSFERMEVPYLIYKTNTTVTIPEIKPCNKEMAFVGYYDSNSMTTKIKKFKLTKDTMIYASWAQRLITQDFENFDEALLNPFQGFDSELYTPKTAGYNKANVHGGNNSFHRIGNGVPYSAMQIMSPKDMMGVGAIYKLTFWVKMDKTTHTKGSIAIASCHSPEYGYSRKGNYTNVINISDLTDNQWHEVTYTFVAQAQYISLRTPGMCSLFFDDFTIEYQGEGAQLSRGVQPLEDYEIEAEVKAYEKYAQAQEQGEEKIVDPNLGSRPASSGSVAGMPVAVFVIIICAAVILIAGGVVLTVILIKNKKNKEAKL
ncbi:MAG: hypothetical protein IJD55_02175 [Clostridia bacterium]|nr:hypothetical protein [Clostridia bacterium]